MDSTLNKTAAKAATLAAEATAAPAEITDHDDAPVAVVHEITRPNSGFRYMKAYAGVIEVRVSVLRDRAGSWRRNSSNVLEILYESSPKLKGATEASAYYPGWAHEKASKIAAEFNALPAEERAARYAEA